MAQEAYVLCGTRIESPTLEEGFGTNTGFRIKDPLRFAQAIAEVIPGFCGGMQGPCMYRDNTAVQAITDVPFKPPGPGDDPEEFGRRLHAEKSALAMDGLFMKANRYAHQGEYRFIWFAGGEPKDFLEVVSQTAASHCQRFG